MKNHYFYENLDTSFINLDALVRYLRRQSFVGAIQVEFAGYMAKIVMADNGKLHVREYDQVTEEVATGEKAYYRILERSNQPGGSVSVAEPRRELLHEDILPIVEDLFDRETKASEADDSDNDPTHEDDHYTAAILPGQNHETFEESSIHAEDENHEERAVTNDHDLLVQITGELLKTIDGSLERAGLDFSAALEKACSDVSDQYPFLASDRRMFKYSAGLVYVNQNTDARLFLKSLGEVLSRVFRYLRSHPECGKVYRFTAQKVQVLLRERKDQFDRLFLTPEIEQALGF